jgi:hypothetical protein
MNSEREFGVCPEAAIEWESFLTPRVIRRMFVIKERSFVTQGEASSLKEAF